MIVVLVTFDLAPEDRERFVAAREDQVRLSRSEAGNLEYALSYDAADDGRVRLTERWESQAALDAHLAVIAERGPIADDPTVLARAFTVFEAEPVT